MSMLSEQVNKIRKVAKCVYLATDKEVSDDIASTLKQAADTIEALSAKLAAANMERSDRYYGGGKKLIEEMAEEIENCYGRETELSDRAREYLLKADYSGGWIACEDRLPEESSDYLITDEDGNSTCAYYSKNRNAWCGIEEGCIAFYPVAWQPLPEPYRQ